MSITPPPPPDVHPAQQTEIGCRGDASSGFGADLAVERERTRRVIVYALLGVIALVVLSPWMCVAIGRLSVADVKDLYVAVAPGWLPALAGPVLAFFFTGQHAPSATVASPRGSSPRTSEE